MPDRVLVEILVAAPFDTVWKAVREPAEICRWFGWEYPSLAADVEWMFVKDVKVDETGRTLYADGRMDRFTLEPHGTHTLVRIIRSAPVTNAGWQGIYDDSFEGWITFMQQLKFALERHPGAARRTIFLNGRAKAAEAPLPIDALDLARLAVVPIGERYAARLPTDETIEGTVWHRSGHQLALTVDGYGDGLLFVGTRPRTAKSLYGGGKIIVTTYGLADQAFDRLRARWVEWWSRQYDVIETQP